MKETRADALLVKRGLAEDKARAQRLIMAGQVRADGEIVMKPASRVPESARLTVDSGPRFVSRGGEKLSAAMETFPVDARAAVCADVGASTGGFTDCLLQNGAVKVYAIDVGHGVLHWKLRNDPRVVVMERTNARYVERLPEPVDLVTVDASFISLKTLLPVIGGWAGRSNDDLNVIALIKPQFEAARQEADRGGGVIRDPAIHQQVLQDVLAFAQEQGYAVRGLMRSPVEGPKGNVEFLAWFRRETRAPQK